MNKRIWRIVGLVAAFLLVLALGAAAGAGITYAKMRYGRSVVLHLDGSDLPDGADLVIEPCGGVMGPGSVVTVRAGEPGAVVTEVEPDSPAAEAGLEEGDVIVAIDDHSLEEEEPADVVASYEPGDVVTLEVRSADGEESRSVEVELGERPDEEGAAYLGVSYWPSSFGLRRSVAWAPAGGWFGPGPHITLGGYGCGGSSVIDVEGGVLVAYAVDDGPAAEAGVESGDVITAVDGETVEDRDDLGAAIAEHEPGDEVTLTVKQAGEAGEEAERQVDVTLGERDGEAYLGVWLGRVAWSSPPCGADVWVGGMGRFRYDVGRGCMSDHHGEVYYPLHLDMLDHDCGGY